MSTRIEQTLHLVRGLREAHKMAFGRRPRRGRVPPAVPPSAIRAEYLTGIKRAVLTPMRNALTMPLLEIMAMARQSWELLARNDAGEVEKSRALIERIARQFQEDVGPAQLARLAALIGKRTSDFQKDELRRQLKSALGVDPLMREPASTQARIEAFTSENVALIKTVPQKFFGEVEALITSGIRQGRRSAELSQEIEERFGVAESNAARIANDQVGKFFGEMNRARQSAIGIDRFIWRTVGDNRVREGHEELDGREFSWSDGAPGEDQFPGDGVNCRCFADPVLDDLLEE